MKDQLVSIKVAKLAKEKGFNIPTNIEYDDTGIEQQRGLLSSHDLPFLFAPTQSLLQRWLREEHNIDLWAQPYEMQNELPDESYSFFLYKDGIWNQDRVDYLHFEEALEKGLEEALKLI